jgi:SH3 domain protein
MVGCSPGDKKNKCGVMCKRLFGILLSALFLVAGNVMAETVYVHDYLRLGVRNHPNSSESAIAVVTTGDALQVLGHNGDYLKIRAEDGTEGWVSQAYVSSEKPARLQLDELRKHYSQREAELKELRQELTATIEKNDSNEKRLTAVSGENATLQQQLSRYNSLKHKYAWVYQSAVVVALFLLGFYLGMRWYKRRITERLGGLEI